MTGKNDQLAGNIIATVATAESVLAQFRDSLVQAGFSEGAVPYTRLADTLLAQRLWVESSGMAEQARFAAVGAHAREIAELLQPYLEAFQRLSVLTLPRLTPDADPVGVGRDGPDPDAPPRQPAPQDGPSQDGPAQEGTSQDPASQDADPSDGTGALVLRLLDESGRPLSFTALRDATRLPRAELAGVLDGLVAAGHIQRTRTSGRELFRRSSAP